MKKNITIAITLLGLVSVSCQKISSNNENHKTFKAVACASIIDDNDTKTGFSNLTTSETSKILTWSANDKIYVVAADNYDLYQLNEFDIDNSSINQGSASFTYGGSVDMSAGSCFAALYGRLYSAVDGGLQIINRQNFLSGNQTFFSFIYPYEQTYCPSGPNPDYLFMLAISNSLDNLTFANYSSVMKVSVKDTRSSKSTLSSIKVKCTKSSISGQFYGFDCRNSSGSTYAEKFTHGGWSGAAYLNGPSYGTSSIEEGGSYGDAVLLKDINVALTDTAQDFYIVIGSGRSSSNHGNITLTLTDTASNSKTYTLSSEFTSYVGKIHKFPVIDFGAI